MSGKVFFGPLSFLLIFSFKTYRPEPTAFNLLLSEYRKADKLYNSPNSSSANDSACMDAFRTVISGLNKIPSARITDSLLYQANYKLGVLYEVYKDYGKATHAYLQSVNHATNATEKFKGYVFAGSGYYNLNNFDSASYYLLRAEENQSNTVAFEDRIRLYNTLGVLYYDNGNYLQSKNYFSQALHLVESEHRGNEYAYGIRLNMAACFYNLDLYKQALDIYRKAADENLESDGLYIGMGRAYAGLHQNTAALASFKKVDQNAVPGVLNEMSKMAIESGNMDSAATWLSAYQHEKKSRHTNPLDDGVNELYSGELNIELGKADEALLQLQTALIIFSGNYTEKDIRHNPMNFTGSFAYYRLFEVLVKKAAAWELKYKKTSRPEDLKSAYNTYQSVISLLSYIERSYEMDDAKILLKQKSGEVYTNALAACLALNNIYPKADYLKEAFLITEKNKASVMNAQIKEKSFLSSTGSDKELASEERNIKYNIALLNAKSNATVDAQSLQKISDEKSEYETQLVNLRRKMEQNSRFYQLKYADDFPSVEKLQAKLTGSQALISFYNEPDKIDVFVLTASALNHVQLDSGESVRRHIKDWIQLLQSEESGSHASSKVLRADLYHELVSPVLNIAGDKKEWIIIPDGLFFLLPLESLPENDKGAMLIEDHAVSYQFSARFIMEENEFYINPESKDPVLSFAPFSTQGADMHAEGMGWLEKLPWSKEEISGLRGAAYTDRLATKEMFLQRLNHYPIVHLATHAKTDLDNSSASYIAFYPATGMRSDDFLFLDEIYSLRLDSCQMMVISACETGRGELVHNEGVMSFARAFLYSGCPSTINTLWKADDHSTAEILKSFYTYLEEGYSKSTALQKAKLDFIKNNPVRRNPAYWSHLILTGNPSALYKKKQPWSWAILFICVGAILFVVVKRGMHSIRSRSMV